LSNLLARYADCVFWMARQIERANSLARILDVNATFSRDSRGNQNWESILNLYADVERFAEYYAEIDASSVIRFYVSDRRNPSSVVSTLWAARENARTLRPLISTEMWVALNTFYGKVSRLRARDLAEENLSRLCDFFKQGCQTFNGVLAETFYRDEGWFFYQIGTNIERADQTTRLLDVKYHLLLPSIDLVGSALDASQWNALLRSAAGFHAFRRIHPSGMTPGRVAGFLLLNGRFPRSVVACVSEAAELLTELRRSFNLRRGAEAELHLLRLRDQIRSATIEAAVAMGMHEHLDWIQSELVEVTDTLGIEFFGHRPQEMAIGTPGAAAGQFQAQSQIWTSSS
jgi:uncharacterized alpha-E superfamily protein